MRVYLDNCALNRLFDDISQERVKIEAEAVSNLLDKIEEGSINLIWSSVVDYENSKSPNQEQRDWVHSWKDYSMIEVEATKKVHDESKSLIEFGLRSKDALHVASAIAGKANYFVTTDDGILKKRDRISSIKVLSPVELLDIIENNDEY